MGRRPKKDRSQVKNLAIQIRVDEKTMDKIIHGAEISSKSISEFLRDSALENADLLEEMDRLGRL